METILHTYYADNAKRLHQIVDKMLLEFGGVSDKDRDDFYSLANEVFVDVLKRYDGKRSFAPFLYSCLMNRIKSEFTKRNRERRWADQIAISLDMPIGGQEQLTWGDIIADRFDLEQTVLEEGGNATAARWRCISAGCQRYSGIFYSGWPRGIFRVKSAKNYRSVNGSTRNAGTPYALTGTYPYCFKRGRGGGCHDKAEKADIHDRYVFK